MRYQHTHVAPTRLFWHAHLDGVAGAASLRADHIQQELLLGFRRCSKGGGCDRLQREELLRGEAPKVDPSPIQCRPRACRPRPAQPARARRILFAAALFLQHRRRRWRRRRRRWRRRARRRRHVHVNDHSWRWCRRRWTRWGRLVLHDVPRPHLLAHDRPLHNNLVPWLWIDGYDERWRRTGDIGWAHDTPLQHEPERRLRPRVHHLAARARPGLRWTAAERCAVRSLDQIC